MNIHDAGAAPRPEQAAATGRATAPFAGGATPAPVSAVIPCYRCADTIGPAVASIAAQTLPPAEVLLVDDCSGDGTLERLHEAARAYPAGWVKVLALPRNGGPSGARNLGWNQASQPYVAFLDADDTWHPQKLRIQMDVFSRDPDVALVAHLMNVQPRTDPAPQVRQPPRVRVLPRRLLTFRSPVPTASIVLRRELPFRFDENRRRAEDYLLWAQILLNGYRCVRVDEVLASWHKPAFGVGGLSGDLVAMRKAAIDVRRTLYRQGLIGPVQMYAMGALSLVRYLRRHVLTWARRGTTVSRASQVNQPG